MNILTSVKNEVLVPIHPQVGRLFFVLFCHSCNAHGRGFCCCAFLVSVVSISSETLSHHADYRQFGNFTADGRVFPLVLSRCRMVLICLTVHGASLYFHECVRCAREPSPVAGKVVDKLSKGRFLMRAWIRRQTKTNGRIW